MYLYIASLNAGAYRVLDSMGHQVGNLRRKRVLRFSRVFAVQTLLRILMYKLHCFVLGELQV
jgi:hypothetical protein